MAPCRLSCQISANQRETDTSANVNKHWKTRAKGKFANRKTLIWIRLYMELMEKIQNIQTSPFRTLETNCDAQDQEVPVWRRCEVYRKWSYWCPPLKSTPPALCIIDAHMKVAPKCYEIAKAIKIIGFVRFPAWETRLCALLVRRSFGGQLLSSFLHLFFLCYQTMIWRCTKE